jgi:hypothetical protein
VRARRRYRRVPAGAPAEGLHHRPGPHLPVPGLRQPAWRGDLDHTIAFEKGGRTCKCNLGALCRTHHRIKQHLGWSLHQTAPGIFTWTTPAGRTFTATPDTHPV